jgi:hypothetical protein
MKQVGTKEIVVNGQTVTVRVFAAKGSRSSRLGSDATSAIERNPDVRHQCTREDYEEFLESRSF